MKKVAIKLVLFYQTFLRTLLSAVGIGSECCYVPSCSEYTKEAIEKYGALKGSFLGLKRISKCGFCKDYKHDPFL